MPFFDSVHRVAKVSSKRRGQRTCRPGGLRFRPALEALEDRCTPAVFTVTTTAVEFDGKPEDGFIGPDGKMSLAEALTAATQSDGNTINFAIEDPLPAEGFWTLTHGFEDMLNVSHHLTIDGYLDSGATANTSAGGDNAKLLIKLADPIQLLASGNTIRGVAFPSLIANASTAGATVDENTIAGCFIGIDPTFHSFSAHANQNGVRVLLHQANDNTIGGPKPADRNIIAGTMGYGVWISGGSHDNLIQGNFIGALPGGTTHAVWRASDGASVEGDFTNTDATGSAVPLGRCVYVAGDDQGGVNNSNVIASNVLAYGITAGVAIAATPSGDANTGVGNMVTGNAIFQNGQGIMTPGRLPVAPILTMASAEQVAGILTGPAGTTAKYTLEFFANDGPDANGNLEGQRFLSETTGTATFGANGIASFSSEVTFDDADVAQLTATVRYDGVDNTSEFSRARANLMPVNPAPLRAFTEGAIAKRVVLATFSSADPGARAFTAEVIDWGGETNDKPAVSIVPSGKGKFRVVAKNIQYKHVSQAGSSPVIQLVIRDVHDKVVGQLVEARQVIDAPFAAQHLVSIEGKAVEGKPQALLGVFVDTNPFSEADEYEVTIEWGDGTTTEQVPVELMERREKIVVYRIEEEHVYDDAGKYKITVHVVDTDPKHPHENPTTLAMSKAIRLAEAPLHITSEPELEISAGQALVDGTVLATFTDENPRGKADNFTVFVSWGDGSRLDAFGGTVVKNEDGSFSVKSVGDHTYLEAGRFTLHVFIFDGIMVVAKPHVTVNPV